MANMAPILFLLENAFHGPAVAGTPAGAVWPQPSIALLPVKIFRWTQRPRLPETPV